MHWLNNDIISCKPSVYNAQNADIVNCLFKSFFVFVFGLGRVVGLFGIENEWKTREYLVRIYVVGAEGLQEKAATATENGMDIIRRDLKDTDITWDEAEELATDTAEWRQRVAGPMHPSVCGINYRPKV